MFKPKGSKLSDIYSSTLSSTLQQGYPLWFPEPHGTGEVQIGDVGFIEDGGLVRLLNVDMGSPEHAVTEWQTAYTPSPLPARALHPDTRPNVFSPGTYKSRGIEESHVGGGLQGGAASTSGGFSVQFECKEERGAILSLKSPATRRTVYDNKKLRSYITTNYGSWVNYVSDDLGLEGVERRIIFVYGWTKTSPDWTVTAFTNHGAKLKASLDAQGASIVSAGLQASVQHTMEGPVVSRHGPAISDPHAPHEKRDQCIFLRYYSVKLRKWWLTKIEAKAGPHQLPGRDGEGQGPGVPSEDTEMQIQLEDDSSGAEHWTGFVDILLDYILEASDAEVAIACSDDVDILLLDQEWPEDLGLFLRQTQPRIEVDDDKCGSLSVYDTICRQRRHDFSTRTTDDLEGQFELPNDQTRAGSLTDGRLLLGPSQSSPTSLDWPHMHFKHKDAENGAITSVSLSPDGTLLAASWDDTIVTVWRLKDGLTVQVLGEEGHADTIWTIAFSPNSETIVSGSADFTSVVWDVATGHIISRLAGHTADVMAVAFDPFGEVVATAAADYTVKLWRAENGELLHDLTGHTSDVMTLAFSPNGTRIASCADTDVILWNPHTGDRIASLQGHTSAIWCMAWSVAGDRLVTGSEDHSSRIWDAETGVELVTLQEHTESVQAVAFSPDGTEVASVSYDKTLVVCDSFSGEQRHIFSGSQMGGFAAETVAYSTKGDLIASGGQDGHVRVWNAHDGEFVAEFHGHEAKVKNVQFTPDDKDIISFSEDATIRVWSVLDAQRLTPSSHRTVQMATD